jgi:pimeloyl-ACP methyl ester carboxylesterase
MSLTRAYHGHTIRAQDGLALFVRNYAPAPGTPQKPTLLCLAGIARHSGDFDDLAQRYAARGHRVIAPDYRGRGASARDPDPSRYRPEVYLDDLRHCLVALDCGAVIAIGSSMGGLLTMAMGVAMPPRLLGAVLNDIGPDIEAAGMGRIADYLGANTSYANWSEAVAALKQLSPGLNPGPGLEAREADWQKVADNSFVEGPDGRLHPHWDPAIAVPLKNGDPIPDLWPLFNSLRAVPTLALRGGASDIFSANGLARMARAHPTMRHITLAHKGHTPSLDEPESLEAIDALIADIVG